MKSATQEKLHAYSQPGTKKFAIATCENKKDCQTYGSTASSKIIIILIEFYKYNNLRYLNKV
jgi:hypothetical protein